MIACYKKDNNSIHSLFYEKNHFDISSIYHLNAQFNSNEIAIKCVLDGVEHYTIDGKKISLKENRYLLTNTNSDCKIEIDSPKSVKGICVNLSNDLISSVVSTLIKPNTAFADLNIGYYFNSNLFLDGEYNLQSNHLGKFMVSQQHIFENIEAIDENFCSELFYNLAENLILDQIPIIQSLQSIKALKYSTKKDLMLKVLKGKEYMDQYYLDPIYIKDIARESCMSDYHFFRLFKEAFKESPYQYLLRRKLEFSYQKLKKESISIGTIAAITGFSDICSFSKSFKKHFGINPSQIKFH